MGLFDKYQNKNSNTDIFVNLHLNARLQPMHRGEFEDMFEDVLKKTNMGELLGGGTELMPTGEVSGCDIEFNIHKNKKESFLSFLHQINIIPKGSFITIKETKTEIGSAEGLAIYLNGTDLPSEVYQNCSINELIEQLDNALNGVAERLSYWEGPEETALYYYGQSYFEIKNKIEAIVKTYPLCEKCRIEQIA